MVLSGYKSQKQTIWKNIIIIEKHFGLQLRKDFSPIEIATLWTVAESV